MSLRGPSRRSAAALVLLPLLVLLSGWAVRASAGGPEPQEYYVSLGDSLARGWQPGSDGRSRDTDQGYVDVVARGLARKHPGLGTVKLGCPGETAASMVRGGTCHYAHGSQLAEAEAFLRSHRNKVVVVTVNIGDNDVEQCLVHAHVDGACVSREMATVRAKLPGIASRLRAAAGKRVRIAGLTDYDQFLVYWLSGAQGQKLARRTVRVVGRLNSTADDIYRRAGVLVADATRAFATTDLSHYVSLRGHGRVPLAVARVCRWTWACSGPPIGFNDHANATGYRVLGNVLLAALRAG